MILFEALVKTRVPHASEQIACEGLAHTSLNHVWDMQKCTEISILLLMYLFSNPP